MNILVTTLGTVWSIVPELLGYTNPDIVDLYRHHPDCDRIAGERARARVLPVDEVWAIVTDGPHTTSALALLNQWKTRVALPIPLRVWCAEGLDDLRCSHDCRVMGNLILQIVMRAAERTRDGTLLLSLTGGRKTMSADMQHAAVLFGCTALVHIIDTGIPAHLRRPGPDVFARPLQGVDAGVFTPIVVSGYRPDQWIDGSVKAVAAGCCIDATPDGEGTPLPVAPSTALYDALDELLKRARDLSINYETMLGGTGGTGYRALYTLPPKIVRRLQEQRIGVTPDNRRREIDLLGRLPKADLHCHLGGFGTAADVLAIAATFRDQVAQHAEGLAPIHALAGDAARAGDSAALRARLLQHTGSENPTRKLAGLCPGVPGHVCMAAFLLLFEHSPEMLDAVVFGPYLDEPRFCGIGITAYESLGDVQGSMLLQSEAAVRVAVQRLAARARDDNVRYLELRCSPAKYSGPGFPDHQVLRCIREELAAADGLTSGIILIASRHGRMSEVHRHIELAVTALNGEDDVPGCPLLGFDLAGNESVRRAEELRPAFLEVMKNCLHITIHAGETAPAESVWEAIYHMNAERIGHGLTLVEREDLMQKVLDRRICIEMCPSSNFQIAGFRDSRSPETAGRHVYPLQQYLRRGLNVTVNTDNTGISRTTMTEELYRAACMSPGGMSLWEVLLLIRNGFTSAFAPHADRRGLLLESEREITGIIQEIDHDFG